MFIAIEGADVCGKGTQAAYLTQSLSAKAFKFPDKDTPIGALIYEHLFEKWAAYKTTINGPAPKPHKDTNAMMFQCMQMANRMEHAQEIRTALYGGQDVVADRYTASGVVYGGSDGLDQEYIYSIQGDLPQPDLNILLDIDLEVAVERMRKRGDTPDRYENEKTLSGVIGRYRKFWVEMRAKESEYRWTIVNGNQPPIEVQAEVITAVKRHYAKSA